jgi:hypothetical protein
MQLDVAYVYFKQLCRGGWIDGLDIDPKTMRAECKRWGLTPVEFDGTQKLYRPEDIEAARQRKLRVRLANAG